MGAIRRLVVLMLALALPSAALATDGVLEINQVCATSTGCLAGDGAGFPVTITKSGSYRLTSDLSVAISSQEAMEIQADRVDLDLNGFSVTICVGVICGIGDPAHAINANGRDSTRIRNGTVQGAGGRGILAGDRSHLFNLTIADCGTGISTGRSSRVEGVTVDESADVGVAMGEGSLLSRSVVSNSGGSGVPIAFNGLIVDTVIRGNNGASTSSASDPSVTKGGYRGCVITENDGGNETQPIAGVLLNLGGNVCGSDTACT